MSKSLGISVHSGSGRSGLFRSFPRAIDQRFSAQKATQHSSLPLASRSSFCLSHHTLCFVFVATNAPFIVGLAVEIPYIRTSGCGFSQDGLALFR